jgi:hypothetical protein
VSDLLGMMEPPLMAGCTATAVSVSISSNVTVISVVLSAQSACGRYLPYRARALAQRGARESVVGHGSGRGEGALTKVLGSIGEHWGA